jgi:hypothetical protein
MFHELKIAKLDLIKIDTEGFEETIVRALLPHIERLKPRAVVFEDNAHSQAGALLARAGYRLFGLRKRLHKLALIPTDGSAAGAFHDYVALLNGGAFPEPAKRAFPLI